ncbi:hypothetical protein AGMMS49546_33570 [Spirochaetia bacterium]|nr:hypothetical protein AGMMS49546_33570 [Spirochaetia bacterium]
MDDDSFDGWIEEEEIKCHKCGKTVEMPKHDGPFEYYETSGPHGEQCPECGLVYCEECGGWGKNDDGQTVCAECIKENQKS